MSPLDKFRSLMDSLYSGGAGLRRLAAGKTPTLLTGRGISD